MTTLTHSSALDEDIARGEVLSIFRTVVDSHGSTWAVVRMFDGQFGAYTSEHDLQNYGQVCAIGHDLKSLLCSIRGFYA